VALHGTAWLLGSTRSNCDGPQESCGAMTTAARCVHQALQYRPQCAVPVHRLWQPGAATSRVWTVVHWTESECNHCAECHPEAVVGFVAADACAE